MLQIVKIPKTQYFNINTQMAKPKPWVTSGFVKQYFFSTVILMHLLPAKPALLNEKIEISIYGIA